MIIDDLRAFVAFMSHGSLSRAAAHLHLTQSAMTRRIQRLEAMIGASVLDRSIKPARVRALGMRLYERAKVVLHEVDGLRELVNEAGEPTGTLRIGATQSVSETTAVSAISLLKRRFPKLRIEMQSSFSTELIRKVQFGQLDAAIILAATSAQLPEEVVGEQIGVHRTAVVAPRTLRLKSPVSLRQLADYPWVVYPEGGIVRAGLAREFHARGLTLNVVVSDYGIEHQLALIAAGAGLGLVSEVMVKVSRYRKKVRLIRVNDYASSVEIWLIRTPVLGKLNEPVKLFGELVTARFGRVTTSRGVA
jgi:DNA-binding transcriptional LysR family regulator